MTPSTVAPVAPHRYMPDLAWEACGDCGVCGHVRESTIHSYFQPGPAALQPGPPLTYQRDKEAWLWAYRWDNHYEQLIHEPLEDGWWRGHIIAEHPASRALRRVYVHVTAVANDYFAVRDRVVAAWSWWLHEHYVCCYSTGHHGWDTMFYQAPPEYWRYR